MKKTIKVAVLLLMSLLGSINSAYTQELRMLGKTVRTGNKLYLEVDGKRCQIGEDVVVVKLKSGVKETGKGLKVISKSRLGYIDLKVPDNTDVLEFIKVLEKSGNYDYIEYDLLLKESVSTNDTNIGNQGYLDRLNVGSAWAITAGVPSIKVAVLDSEVQCSHEDLGMGTDNYKNVDQSLGHNYVGNWTSTGVQHGTAVAGVIAAKTNNGKGVAGIAGGNNSQGVTVIPYCISDAAGAHSAYIDDAIEDAVSKGVKIINMSFGDLNALPSYVYQAIEEAYNNNITLVASSGNDGLNSVRYPAKYDQVIAVGGVSGDYRTSSANYGTGLDFVAPSVNVYTTDSGNSYGSITGTSFSTPQVTGVIALMLSVKPSLTPLEIKSILKKTATKLPYYTYDSNGWNHEVGYGLLNAYDAVIFSMPIGISGSTQICDQGSFTISNIPSGSAVALNTNYSSSGFSVTGSSNINISSYSNGTLFVQKVANGKGYLKLYYKGYLLSTREFWVGTPVITDVYYMGGNVYMETDWESCPDIRHCYVVINGTRYRLLGGMGGVPLHNGTYDVEAYMSNQCGESDHYYGQIVITGSYRYSIADISGNYQVAIEIRDRAAFTETLKTQTGRKAAAPYVSYSLKNAQSGIVIAEGKIPAEGGIVDFSGVSKGLYLLEITPPSGSVEAFKIQFK